ncbi:hypothetical protein C2845_PM05G20390 [Panicum miliaceum]|uniref:Uncharacterized protein n=1 Tax=Panicum miliaceum TaxID=4540 RepID=A0A3L6T591_PANMI|nr:hypothetical protein C2845_PM05G20390 [Panicum miliaceum]
MSDEAAASGSAKSGGVAATTTATSNDSFEAVADELLLDPAEDDEIEARVVAQLFRGASPGARRRAAARQAALRAQREALLRQVAESRAQARRLRGYARLLLRADVSGYTEAQAEQYRREVRRRSEELFGK